MQNSNEMQDQYESEYLENSFSLNKMINESSQKDQSMSYVQLAKLHLKQYEDIDENQFQFVEEAENINMNSQKLRVEPNNYLKLHSTIVPIGHNFQADLPEITPIKTYLKRNQKQFQRLQSLRIHDPKTNQLFYNQHKAQIISSFGQNRTYQQIACIKKCMDLYQPGCSLQKYFGNQKIFKFWEQQFKNKDNQALKRLKKKKKKYKGSMDV